MARPPSLEITGRQQEALRMIRNFIVHHRMPPTVRELAEAMHITSSTAFYLLGELERKGHIRRDSLRARSLIPHAATTPDVNDGARLPRFPALLHRPAGAAVGLVAIPILGTAAAGRPILAVEDRSGDLWVGKRLAARGRCFGLKIKGDSMIRAGIKDGDIAVARQQPLAQSGDIVVALLKDEATIKELSIRGDRIELKPRNPTHRSIPIGPEDELRILGKVIAVAAGPHREREN